LDETILTRCLERHEPSITNLLSSITAPYMVQQGKRRWVEKTPDHLQYVSLIRRYFPDSPIIRIVRDPRDVSLSLLKVPWGAKTLVEALSFWKRLHDSSIAFFDEDPCSYTVRFEDLLSSPQETLRALCDFIDEAYEEQMLDTSQTGSKVNSRQVAWKEKASQPIDRSRAAAWRDGLSTGENRLAEALVGDYLERFHYPRLADLPYLAEVYPAPLPTDRHTAELIGLAGKGVRFWRRSPDEKPAARIYVGDPGDYHWLGKRKPERALRAAVIAKDVIQAHFTHKKLFWIADEPVKASERALEISRAGYPATLLQGLLNRHRVSHSA
ncbi:MAG: sulfotransferase, partial [Anaerolineae bacterium]|nr:sulfotransferase [Anaerolineae bacterium]